MNVVGENAGPVALLEATAEARTLIEELTRLAEELKGREERLGELLAPSEAALRARTDYLDNVMRDELARAEQRVLKLAEEVSGIARCQQEDVLQMIARLAETDAQRRSESAGHERSRMIVSLLAMLVGGFLTGQVANWRSGAKETVRPAAIEPGTSVSKARAGGAAAERGPEREAHRQARALSREAIAQSVELQRRYAQEYASMLRVVPDREVAKEAARLNVSALWVGQPRIVPADGRFSVEKLRSALARSGEDLGTARRALSHLAERAAPAISRVPLARARDSERER
jgi:NOL1/NOP2/fmu family ribosome biogenesis protein